MTGLARFKRVMHGLVRSIRQGRGRHRVDQGHRRGHCPALGRSMAHGSSSRAERPTPARLSPPELTRTSARGSEVAKAIPCNISHKEQLEALVKGARDAFGKIDILVCNAAINPYFGPMAGAPDDAFDRIMATNVRSNFWLCNMVLPEMAARKDGSIINRFLDRRRPRRGAFGRLRNIESRRLPARAQHRRRVRTPQCPRQRDRARIIKTYFAKALWENEEILGHANSGNSPGPHRNPRRDRRSRRLLGEPRRRLYDGAGPRHRRRTYDRGIEP